MIATTLNTRLAPLLACLVVGSGCAPQLELVDSGDSNVTISSRLGKVERLLTTATRGSDSEWLLIEHSTLMIALEILRASQGGSGWVGSACLSGAPSFLFSGATLTGLSINVIRPDIQASRRVVLTDKSYPTLFGLIATWHADHIGIEAPKGP
jgi:hypothetical protein